MKTVTRQSYMRNVCWKKIFPVLILMASLLAVNQKGNAQTGPGGVATNLRLWLKANTGVTTIGSNVTTWTDQSTNALNFTQATTSSQPILVANSINFNPVVNFTSDVLNNALGITGTASVTDVNVYAVIRVNSTVGNPFIFQQAVNTNEFAIYFPFPNNGNIYWRAGITGTNDLQTSFASISTSKPTVYGFTASTTTGQTVTGAKNAILANGKVLASGTNITAFTGAAANVTLGSGMPNDDIAEIITYTGAITPAQQNQIQSYLAIKYGITLDQTTPTDYVSAGGLTTVWSASSNAGFTNNIFGIASDATEGLTQTQSKSINNNRISIANPSTLVTGGYFMVSDNGATSLTPIANTTTAFTPTPPVQIVQTLPTVWRVSQTGAVGTVDVTISSPTANPYLIIDPTGTGVYNSVATAPTSQSGTYYTFAGVPLLNGMRFTLGYTAAAAAITPVAPGGVTSNLRWWLKAGAGTSTTTNAANVSTWADQSGNGNDATQATVAKQPAYATSAFNGNPALTFDQSADGMTSPLNISATPYSFFTVYNDNTGISGNRRVIQGSNNWLIGPYNGANRFYSGGTFVDNAPAITNKAPIITLSTTSTAGSANSFFYLNGKNNTNPVTGATSSGTPGAVSLGAAGTYNEPPGSNVAEVLAYDRVLTAAEQLQVQSYLAIKYGISIDQTAATNYVSSAGTVVWNATANSAYPSNIFGLGVDASSGLSQLSSVSANTSRIAISSPSPALVDGNFFIISDNNLSNVPVTTASLPGTATSVTPLKWDVSKTGFAGSVTLTITSGLASPILLIDNNSDGTYEAFKTPASNSGTSYTFTGVNLSDNAKFALGYAAALPVGPAGVSTNLKLWFNAGVGLATTGTTVTSWADQSVNGDNATPVGTAPVVTTNAINGYPVVKFGTVSGGALVGNFVSHLTSNRSTAFVITKNVYNGQNDGVFAVGNGASDASATNSALLFYENGAVNADISTYRGGTTLGKLSPIPLAASPHMYTSIFNATQNLFYSDGAATTNATYAQQNFDASKFSMGAWYSNGSLGNFSSSTIAEAILYDRDLTTAEQQKVQSYLGFKYGLTLPNDYTNFAGTTIWSQTTNTGYNNDIAGIGIDNSYGLTQTSSISANNYFLKISTPSALVNGDFLMIGSNSASYVEKSTDAPGGNRTAHVWKVQKTGAPGTVTLKFYVGAYPEVTPATLSQCALLISSTPTFAAATPYTTGAALSGAANDTLTFTGVSLANAAYFTLALPAPLTTVNTKWFAVPQWNTCSNLNQPQYLYLTAPLAAATAIVDEPGNSSFVPIKVDLTSGLTTQVNITPFMNNSITTPANTIVGRGLRITVTGSKVVGYYQDASPLNFGTLPLKSPYEVGLEFYVPGQSTFSNSTGNCGPTNYCETIIMSTVDNNSVTITPTEDIVGHTLAAGPFTITLNKGQSYQAQSISYTGIHQSGEHIVSTGNVAVTYIDDYLDAGGQDNAGDQLVPVTKLGTSYVSLRTNLTGGNANLEQTQIIGTVNGTTVTVFDGTTTTNLTVNAGQRVTYTLPTTPTQINAAYITSNNPVSAYQIGGVGAELGGGILPPIFTCSGSPSIAYFRNNTISNINADVIVPTGAQGGFTVNGSTTILQASDFTVVPGLPNWMYCRKDITSLTSANTLLNISNSIASFHMGFTELSAGGGDYCYFSEFVTVPIDYGDLPAPWPIASAHTAGCASSGGVTLSNANTINSTSVWAGAAVDFEEVAKINATATGDANDDGLVSPTSFTVGKAANFTVTLNSNNPAANTAGTNVYFRLWIDWNNDGNFTNDVDASGNPATYAGVGVSHSPVTVNVPVTAPASATSNASYAVRLIASDVPVPDTYRASGATSIINVANGEVEDYIVPVSVVLPVTFGDVSAQANNCIVFVSFDTKSESNSKSFTIEHSPDGVHFTSLHDLAAAGNSSTDKDYSYVDATPFAGVNYYRVKETDKDGGVTYSKIVSATVNCNGNATVAMFPNPVHTQLTVVLPTNLQNAQIQLMNNLGQVILADAATSGSVRLLNMGNLSSGIYVLKIVNGNNIIMTQKVVKQ